MRRGHVISAVVLLSALATVGTLAGTAAVAPTAAQEANASISFDDQTATETITVESATLPDGGYVVVFNSSGAVVGNSSLLDAGTHETVNVSVTPPIERSGVYIGQVHRDNDSNGAFNASVDAAYNTSTGAAVSSTAYVTVESAGERTTTEGGAGTPAGSETTDAGESDTAEGTDADGTGTATGSPGFTAVGALVALVAAALLARRS